MKAKRITKADILKDILAHFPRTTGEITQITDEKYLRLETDHGKAERIGQYVMSVHSKQVYTYVVCHIFRKATVSIYFK